jgi:hypothetical protein
MPGYAKKLRTLANTLEEAEGLLKEWGREELEDIEGDIDELEEQIDQALEKATEAADNAEGKDEDEDE